MAFTCERDHVYETQEDLLVLHGIKLVKITINSVTNRIGYDDDDDAVVVVIVFVVT